MGDLRVFASALIIVAVAAGTAAWEAPLVASEDSGRLAIVTSGVSMDQAVKMAEQRFKARVVRADTQHEGPRTIYILKLLDEAGHVWTVRVDATNGAIL
jgi:uncharacterized membrane protein YkoI